MSQHLTSQLEFPIALIEDNLPKERDANLLEMIFDHHLPDDWDRVGEVYVANEHVGALCMKEMNYA
jgi:hypothetical protein